MFSERGKEYEQISIDTESYLPYKYNQLDASGKIFSKVDWATIIFTDCSMNDVLSWIKLTSSVSEFLKQTFEVSRGYSDIVKYMYNGIMLETNKFSFYGDSPLDVFDVTVPKLRLEISGSGLDYLRSLGVDFNTYRLTNPPKLPDGATYHYSRIDFAYDFIDYQPEFLDKLIQHCNTHALASGRVPLISTHGAIKCKIVTGDRKVCYLGSEQSDRFLRVYDKRLQSINRNTGVYVKENPYNNPDSWIRIEWQLRNKQAHGAAVDSSHTFKTILKQIFECYSMADGTVQRDRTVVDFWNELFPWREVESRIIQNQNFVQVETPLERLLTHYRNCVRNTVLKVYTALGHDAFFEDLRLAVLSMGLNDEVSIKRRLRFTNQLNELNISSKILHFSDPLASGICIKDGLYYFKE